MSANHAHGDHAHRPLIVGTAGHIDHGKTALIRLLTGVDTDRLKQEKERGISIELGFTALALPDGQRMGVVDVPGHERFIKNMLAGAGGIDLILFVIAADEGVMPQTREHMDIIDLLGVQHGVVALTKIDMVESDFVDIVEETVQEYLANTSLAGAPIVRVSSTTGEGRDRLVATLAELAGRIDPQERGHLRRLPIDRIFIMEGFGTVVTGTLWAGHLSEGESVRILPGGIDSRIKALEVHNRRVKTALAGQRVAVSLHAVGKSAIERGDWVVAGEGPEPTTFVDARLRVLRSASKPLANSQRVRFHLGSAELLGRLILLDCDQIEPGGSGWGQLRLESPVLTERGDRFVLRTYSPMHTVAGGTVVTAGVGRRRRKRREDIKALEAAQAGTPQDRVHAVLMRRGPRGGAREDLMKESGCRKDEVDAAVTALVARSQSLVIGKNLVVSAQGYESAALLLRQQLEEYHQDHPLSWGLLKSELKQRLKNSIDPALIEQWVEDTIRTGDLYVRSDRLRFGSDQLDLGAGYQRLSDEMLAMIRTAGYSGCRQKEVLEAAQEKIPSRGANPSGASQTTRPAPTAPADRPAAADSAGSTGSTGSTGSAGSTGSTTDADWADLRRMPVAQLQKDLEALLLLLADSGRVVRVPPHFYFDAEAIEELIGKVREYFQTGDELAVGNLKELVGVSRKQAIPLLEFLDFARITQRRGDARVAGPRLRADREEAKNG